MYESLVHKPEGLNLFPELSGGAGRTNKQKKKCLTKLERLRQKYCYEFENHRIRTQGDVA